MILQQILQLRTNGSTATRPSPSRYACHLSLRRRLFVAGRSAALHYPAGRLILRGNGRKKTAKIPFVADLLFFLCILYKNFI